MSKPPILSVAHTFRKILLEAVSSIPRLALSFWKLGLRLMPLLSAVLVIAAALTAWRDLRREQSPKPPDQPYSSGLVRDQVTLDSFDIDTQTVRAHAQVYFDSVPSKPQAAHLTTYPQTFYCQADAQFRLDLSNPILFVGFNGQPQFGDLGRPFSQGGLRLIQDVQPLGPCDPTQSGAGFVKYALPVQTALYAVGDPRRFPFDRYLVIYRIWSPILIEKPGGGFVGILGLNETDSNITGFSMAYPSAQTIEGWTVGTNRDPRFQNVGYREDMWAGRQMAVVLERGLFMRATTIILALVVFAYLVRFAFQRAEKEKLVPDILGFFLTVWAIRSALSVGGPHFATVIDYGALLLYITFIGILLAKVSRRARLTLDEEPVAGQKDAPPNLLR